MTTKNQTILVIDDSNTIRRLVDTNLSREGYKVVLAPTAEEGIQFAGEIKPDMILLDHQLPGTTGTEVCKQLMADPELAKIPVVISSTLRKQAYVEYADSSNVVDMLPKPYTEELLLTTVSNALSTGTMVVNSQAMGTAVPEVVQELGEADFQGVFRSFSIREVLDFLNNGRKQGSLEVEAGHNRYSIHLANGRVQGITSTGTPVDEIVGRLPDSLSELAPVLRVTLGKGGGELDGIVDLLNTKVLDPRLLRKLLRHQAAVLLTKCFTEQLKGFRFDSERQAPPLYQRLQLDVSALALLIEGAMTADSATLPSRGPNTIVARQPIRGQNLDRAGLSAHQTRIFGKLAAPQSTEALARDLGWSEDEVHRVIYGLELAQLVACKDAGDTKTVIVLEGDLEIANRLKTAFAGSDSYQVQVIQDVTAFKILAQRSSPNAVVFDTTLDGATDALQALRTQLGPQVAWIASGADETVQGQYSTNGWVARPYTAEDLLNALDTSLSNAAAGTPVAALQEATV